MREVECYVVCVGKRSGFVRRTLVGDISHSASPVYCHFECSFIVSTQTIFIRTRMLEEIQFCWMRI